MLDSFPFRIRLVHRTPTTPLALRPRGGWRRRRVLVAALGAFGVSCFFAMPAAAGTATVTATVNIVQIVFSVTVSPSAVTLSHCTGGNTNGTALGFPNGICGPADLTQVVTVTNTGNAGHISFQGSNATPNDNTTAWTLCPVSQNIVGFGPNFFPTCVDSSGNHAGVDQFSLQVQASTSTIIPEEFVFPTAAPDLYFGAGGAATSGENVQETLSLLGPSSASDPNARSVTAGVTYTAAS